MQQSGGSPYRVTQAMASAMDALIAENPTNEAGKQTMAMGQGTWEVCHMPDSPELNYWQTVCCRLASRTSSLAR